MAITKLNIKGTRKQIKDALKGMGYNPNTFKGIKRITITQKRRKKPPKGGKRR